MSHILILYGTSEGHTEKVATIIANTLTDEVIKNLGGVGRFSR